MSLSENPYAMTPEAMMQSMKDMTAALKTMPSLPSSPLMMHPTAAGAAAAAIGFGMATQMMGMALGSMQGALQASRKLGMPVVAFPEAALRMWDLTPPAEGRPVEKVARETAGKAAGSTQKSVEKLAKVTAKVADKAEKTVRQSVDVAVKATKDVMLAAVEAPAKAQKPSAQTDRPAAPAAATVASRTAEPVARRDMAKAAPQKATAQQPPKQVAAAGGAKPAGIDRPETPDDLKLIAGVGPKLEQVLNGLGLCTYEQIVALGEAEIQWIEDHLQFKGRIERDDWVGQARSLQKK
jgi:NADH-quinone oxidoreductase subunit E